MADNELLQISQQIKKFIPRRILKKLAKERRIRENRSEDIAVLLAQRLSQSELLELFEEYYFERFITFCLYRAREKFVLEKETLLKLLKENNCENILNLSDKEILEKRKHNPLKPGEVRISTINYDSEQIEFKFNFLKEDIVRTQEEELQPIYHLRNASAIMYPKNELLVIFTRNNEEGNLVRDRITQLTKISFGYCYFSEEAMLKWVEWASTLQNASTQPLSSDQIQRLRYTAKSGGNLKQSNEYLSAEKEALKNGVYIKFTSNGYDIGAGIYCTGRIYFRTHIGESDLRTILDKSIDLIGDKLLPIVKTKKGIETSAKEPYFDLLTKVVSYPPGPITPDMLTKVGLNTSELKTMLEYLRSTQSIGYVKEVFCPECNGPITRNEDHSNCLDCEKKYDETNNFASQECYMFLNSGIIKHEFIDHSYFLFKGDQVRFEVPNKTLLEFDLFSEIRKRKIRNMKRVLESVRKIKELDKRTDHDLTHIFADIFELDPQKHHGLEIADICGFKSNVKYKGEEISYAALLKSGKLNKKDYDNLVHQIVRVLNAYRPTAVFLIVNGILPNHVLSELTLTGKRYNSTIMHVNSHDIARILIYYKKICISCGSQASEENKCIVCNEEKKNRSPSLN